mgnify:CR=1 FL=1
MADMAHEEGVFQESESKVIKNLLTFKDIMAKSIMTPRTVMKAESDETTVEDFFNKKSIFIVLFKNNHFDLLYYIGSK